MKNEEGTYKQGKFLSNKLKPEGLRVDPVRGSARGAKGGPGEGERLPFRVAHTYCLDEEWPPPLAGTREPVWD